MKKKYAKFQKQIEKKSILISFACYEYNMVDINYNTWWIDYGSTIHISITLQGMKNQRKVVGNEQNIYLENKMCSHVKAYEHAI